MAFFKSVLEYFVQLECKLSTRWVQAAHKRLLNVQWSLPPQPEHFDHHIDLFYQWRKGKLPFWLERGFIGNMCVQTALVNKSKVDILDLCCGDGFYSKYFYSYSANSIQCLDFDKKAISTAKKKNQDNNIKHIQGDIRFDFPAGKFDIIIWDAAFEHFTLEESQKIIKKIKDSLSLGGLLACYTVKERDSKQKQLSHHEYEPKSKEEFASFFRNDFTKVAVFETIYDIRHNLYLVASDVSIPFTDEWPLMTSFNTTPR